MNAALLSLTLFLAAGQFAPQQAGSEPLEPRLEARVQALGKELRCAVCQGMSVADSPSSMARAQLDKVRELVTDGKSDQEIRDYFVARYGEWVLLQPNAEGVNLLVWLGPVLLLVGGAFVVFRQVRRAPSSPAVPTPPPSSSSSSSPVSGAAPGSTPGTAPNTAPGAGEPVDPYLAAVRREMEQ